MVSLYIDNRLVELDSEVQFAINKTFEDITNPTLIINDWSKTVSIPFTQTNNEIFGHIYNPDRITLHDSSMSSGLYFDPLKKIDFRLEWDSAILISGYAKMTSITKSSNQIGRYNLTLNGELGKIFQEMKKITFDKKTDNTDYLIDGAKYVQEQINKELIQTLWSNEGNTKVELVDKTSADYNVNNFINFVPNNSFCDNFNYKTYQTGSKILTFAETLDSKAQSVGGTGTTYSDLAPVDAETAIGEGLLPREIGEYRSYMQLPYIYFNKLFQIFNAKVEEITGYKSILDESWFNNGNDFWNKSVYMLKRLFSDKGDDESKQTSNIDCTTIVSQRSGGNWAAWTSEFEIKNLTFPDEMNLYNFRTLTNIDIWTSGVNDNQLSGIRNTAGIELEFKVYDKNNNNYNTLKYLLVSPTSTYKPTQEYNGIFVLPNAKGKVKRLNNFLLNIAVIGGSKIKWRTRLVGESPYFFFNSSDSTATTETSSSSYYLSGVSTAIGATDDYSSLGNIYSTIDCEVDSFSNVIHTNYLFDLNDLWNNEYNLFDEILDYCKMFRIGVFCDPINKTITYKPLNVFFKDYTIEDWTDKVDLSRSFTIQPITFNNKYLLFNYNAANTLLNSSYKKKFGLNFGEYRLSTDYEFNTETKNLFSKINSGMCATDYIKSWTNIYDNLDIIYTVPAEIMVYNKTEENKNVDLFGAMFIYNGLTDFDTSSDLRSVSISDDTTIQETTREFTYSQNTNSVRVLQYPLLNVKTATNDLLLFNKPMESYIYDQTYFNNTTGIYQNIWQNYLDERYNSNNKIVTCWLYLKPTEYINFSFNKFIKIENQLYMINKIYDYDITNNTPTKVDLITIQNIEGYTESAEFNVFEIYIKNATTGGYELWDSENDYIDLNQHSTKTIYITSTGNTKWATDQNIQLNLEINGEVGSGIIEAGDKVPVNFYNDEYGLVEGYVSFTNGKKVVNIFVRVR